MVQFGQRDLAKVLIVLGLLVVVGTLSSTYCTLGATTGCPDMWGLVPAFLLLGVVLLLAGLLLRRQVKVEDAREGRAR